MRGLFFLVWAKTLVRLFRKERAPRRFFNTKNCCALTTAVATSNYESNIFLQTINTTNHNKHRQNESAYAALPTSLYGFAVAYVCHWGHNFVHVICSLALASVIYSFVVVDKYEYLGRCSCLWTCVCKDYCFFFVFLFETTLCCSVEWCAQV